MQQLRWLMPYAVAFAAFVILVAVVSYAGQKLGTQIGGIATAVGLVFTAMQFAASRSDQRRILALSLVDRLSTDEELAFCSRALDWAVGPLAIPAKYKSLWPANEFKFTHDLSRLRSALSVDLPDDWDESSFLTYRYCFDAFFAYLDSIRHHIAVGNVRRSELVGLDYYFEILKNGRYLSRGDFVPFVATYYPDLALYLWPGKATTCEVERAREERRSPALRDQRMPLPRRSKIVE